MNEVLKKRKGVFKFFGFQACSSLTKSVLLFQGDLIWEHAGLIENLVAKLWHDKEQIIFLETWLIFSS